VAKPVSGRGTGCFCRLPTQPGKDVPASAIRMVSAHRLGDVRVIEGLLKHILEQVACGDHFSTPDFESIQHTGVLVLESVQKCASTVPMSRRIEPIQKICYGCDMEQQK
jgi:hypothetical protein